MIMHCIPLAFSQCFMHSDVFLNVENCVLVGLDWVEPMMQSFLARHMFMHISCIRTLSFLSLYYFVIVLCLFLSLSRIDYAWHPSANLLWLGMGLLLIFLHLFFTFGSMMGRPNRTSLRTFRNVTFIRSTMLFCRAFLTLLSLLSFRLRAGNLFVRGP